ncbi:putative wall-associated receptor kinase-like 16 [Juglans microcarpa x Juglans regia]|uniref:putative wall-associated receptor kinase-like 16 n=1 Tax=Juglans microcarpa x Juglans regia TaxID=2249226 RepID=UPI001B7F0847|nr:putative wall-associated receptor kinase-like 16 [Juglans microcarpa x Juglans regia]XP_040997698.1 putative wall-associated receptor kinase-like 16 [Juglans microcarpa x Juglans regia]XP_040997699.1 putative wall-associated receptor kinase-like 16 [Juglans microcarpa x Juglans regia]XP_040997700.1 putative wall-associated receptor kinase-like 16 [Juglans microcarpa x Juglans regia]XP_040997701.1 putative wall-associated receptor kinase-like 16 [Juglans microcarpa x Juglans regia]
MAFNGKLLQPLLVLGELIVLMILVASVASTPNSGCDRRCGSVKIPYPFGTSEGCYLDSTFLITCNNTIIHGPKPSLGPDMFVEDISVLDGELRVSNPVASLCKVLKQSGEGKPTVPSRTKQAIPCSQTKGTYSRCIDGGEPISISVNYSGNSALFKLSNFRISNKRNKITAVGCGVYSFIQGSVEQKGFTTGCLSLCNSNVSDVVNGSCSGIGCCQTSIPKGATEFDLSVRSLSEYNTTTLDIGECAFGFIVDEKAYNFSSLDFSDLLDRKTVPLVLDWAVGNETCKDAEKNMDSYACKANNSYCYDSSNGPGYRCNCSDGYQGNPYLPVGPDSCQDINECISLEKPCAGNATCNNTDGNYTCTCQHGYEGDGRMPPGIGCRPRESQSRIIAIALGISSGLLVLLLGSSLVYWVLQKRKLIKLKEKWFQQNGGMMLQQRLPNQTGSTETAKVFSTEELEKATDNYNKSRVLGQGGYGVVYKGILSDNRVVAIKKSKIGDQSQIEQFINEVIVLTQINHRNVVKLLGCCLETEVPMLVYEFITNGTLSDHLHDKSRSSLLSWDNRLKIATESAGALAYLHFEASMPIIHRDVKTANILLDENHTAKVSDFGASRLVPLDQTQLTTLVQGTLGYLDPEYFHTSHLTEKSDVYSFGVVLAELLTGKKVISLDRPESERNLATYFVSMVKDDRLVEVLDDNIHNGSYIEELKKVANVAKRCLSVKGDDRPSMKEVAVELDGLRVQEKKARKEANLNTEESEYFLHPSTHSLSIDVGVGYSSTSTIDSMGNQALKPTDDGR